MKSPENLGGHVVVKAQVHTGGRGKAGGVKLANSPDEAEEAAARILGMDIKGFTVNKVLIDQQAPGIEQEIYLAVLIDRGRRLPMIMASAAGGMDIEEVAETSPKRSSRSILIRTWVYVVIKQLILLMAWTCLENYGAISTNWLSVFMNVLWPMMRH